MFTGLIQAQGHIRGIIHRAENSELSVTAPELVSEIAIGDSVAVNGACLTAETVSPAAGLFTATAVKETLSRSTLSLLRRSDLVNLELSLSPTDRLGGHFLQGHVDAIGRCLDIRESQGSWLMRFNFPREFGKYIVEKGSIAVDGISLTAFGITGDTFTASIVPHTFKHTTLNRMNPGTNINLEFDLIGKYIAKQQGLDRGTITIKKLREYGY